MPDLLVESTNNTKANSEAASEATEAAELNNNKTNNLHQSKVYASVAEMKRMKLQASKKSSSSEDPTKPSQDLVVSNGGLRKGFSSTPDLKSTTEVPLIPLEELKIKIGVKTNVSKTDLDLSQPHH